MDNDNRKPTHGEACMDTSDWRSQLNLDSRLRTVNKIMEYLKRILPIVTPYVLQELRKMAVRFEEKIYNVAPNLADYLIKIYIKMVTMETEFQNSGVPGSLPSNPVGGNQNPPDPEKNQKIIEVFGEVEDCPSVIRRLDRTPSARRKRSRTTDVSDALQPIEKVSAAKLKRIASTSATSTARTPPLVTMDYSIAACHSLLDTMTDIPKELYQKTLKRIWEDRRWRESFIVCQPEKRTWMLEMIDL